MIYIYIQPTNKTLTCVYEVCILSENADSHTEDKTGLEVIVLINNDTTYGSSCTLSVVSNKYSYKHKKEITLDLK